MSRIKDPRPFDIDELHITNYDEVVGYIRHRVSTSASANLLTARMLTTNTKTDVIFCLGHATGEFEKADMLRYQHLFGVVHPYLGDMTNQKRPTTMNEAFYHGVDIGTRAKVQDVELHLSRSGMIRMDEDCILTEKDLLIK